MGTLMIKEEPVLRDIKGKIEKVESAIKVGETIILKLGTNTYSVCRSIETERWAFPLSFGSWYWQRDFIKALQKLGIMKVERANELISVGDKEAEDQEREWQIASAQEIAKKYGYKLVRPHEK